MDSEENVEVEKVQCEIEQFEWRIPNYFASVSQDPQKITTSAPFSIAGFQWQINLFHYWCYEFIDVCLSEYYNDVKRKYSVECYFGLKKCDGSVEQFASKILEIKDADTAFMPFIKKLELIQRRSELVPCDVLTVVCTLKLMTESGNSSQLIMLDEVKPLKLISK